MKSKILRREAVPAPRLGHDVHVDCPFCEGFFETREMGIVHSVPPCVKFESLDVVDFMIAARKQMGISAPWDSEN